jgi:hypothetical protein
LPLFSRIPFLGEKIKKEEVRISSDIESRYVKLLRSEMPVDLTQDAILILGVKRLLESKEASEQVFRRSPEEELERRRRRNSELDRMIREKTVALRDQHQCNLTYREDNEIVEYYLHDLDIAVKRMREVLAKETGQ